MPGVGGRGAIFGAGLGLRATLVSGRLIRAAIRLKRLLEDTWCTTWVSRVWRGEVEV